MNRLTTQMKDTYFTEHDNVAVMYCEQARTYIGGNVLEKLGQLEDWEDLYGIDLLTLLKTESVYWRTKWTGIQVKKSFKCYIDLHNHQLIVYENEYDEFGNPLPFEDYGITWALTRKELEK